MIDQDILDKLTPEERERLEWQAPKPVTRSTGFRPRSKPGIQTTEFWITAAVALLPLLDTVQLPEWTTPAAAIVYTIARAVVKIADAIKESR